MILRTSDHSILSKGFNFCHLQVSLEDIESSQNSGMKVAFPSLNMIIGIVSKPGKVGSHRAMILDQRTEKSLIISNLLIEMIPFVKLYLFAFYSGKESTKAFGSSDSVTVTAGELWMCFLASISSWINRALLKRKFYRVVAQNDPQSPNHSKLWTDFLHNYSTTFKSKPYFFLFIRLQIETEVLLNTISLLQSVRPHRFKHLLKRGGQKMPLNRRKSFTESVNEIVKLSFSSGNPALLSRNKLFIEDSESLSVKSDLKGRISACFHNFHTEIYALILVILL